MGLFAMWCRAFRGIGLFPDQIRRLRVWEVAVLLDADIEGGGPAMTFEPDPDAPPGAPRLSEVD